MSLGRHALLLHFLRLLRDQRGQAMVEYSTLTFALLIGAVGGLFAFPAHAFGMHVSLAQAIYASIQTYTDSFYFSLHLLTP